mgnify:CR=1 FL=1
MSVGLVLAPPNPGEWVPWADYVTDCSPLGPPGLASGSLVLFYEFADRGASDDPADQLQGEVVEFLKADASLAHVQFLAAGSIFASEPVLSLFVAVDVHQVQGLYSSSARRALRIPGPVRCTLWDTFQAE